MFRETLIVTDTLLLMPLLFIDVALPFVVLFSKLWLLLRCIQCCFCIAIFNPRKYHFDLSFEIIGRENLLSTTTHA